ncbi:MAG: histidine--tRNA ligase [Ignavibacteria bacterium]|nr:histidine--tRNA ligase [Ignavibacteria bacterium]
MISTVRGMKDIFGDEMSAWHYLETTFRSLSAAFGYAEFRTPLLEHTELFARGVGEGTDIVGKEMYTFADRGGDSLTLRPEMTAPIVRAAIEHNLLRNAPTTRLWYMGPLFRYERPQKGRYRQFHQYGAELIGSAHPEADVEIIELASEVLRALQLNNVTLELNTLGSPEARVEYRKALVEYLNRKADGLSADSKNRLIVNPLRILDSKDEADKAVVADAPVLLDFLDATSVNHFESVKAQLATAGISYTLNSRLVRGLDYYSHTVFEFTSPALGAQNTVCAGGRYDPLFAMLGGADVPAVGFSAGVERLLLILQQQDLQNTQVRPDVYICAFGEEARTPAHLIALRMRRNAFSVITDVQRRSPKAQLKDAARVNARYAVLIGEDELASGTAIIREMDSGTQSTVPITEIERAIAR